MSDPRLFGNIGIFPAIVGTILAAIGVANINAVCVILIIFVTRVTAMDMAFIGFIRLELDKRALCILTNELRGIHMVCYAVHRSMPPLELQ